jgi:hypothetical protein
MRLIPSSFHYASLRSAPVGMMVWTETHQTGSRRMQRNNQSKQLFSGDRGALLRDSWIDAALVIACIATAALGATLARWW